MQLCRRMRNCNSTFINFAKMQTFVLILAAVGITIIPGVVADETSNTTKCVIHLFYDVNCPYAVDFIIKKVCPFMGTELGKYARFDPNPFGSARKKADGSYQFRGGNKCKHEINHACVIYKQNSTTTLKFMGCSAKQRKKADGDESCAKKVGINYKQLSECANGEDGKKYFEACRKKTKGLVPPLEYVPLVCFNNKCGKDDRAAGNADIKAHVCKIVPEVVRKAHC